VSEPLRDLAARAAHGDRGAEARLATAARREARDILAEGRFREVHHHDNVVRRALSTLGDWISSINITGGSVPDWLFFGVLALLIALVAGSFVVRRRPRSRLGAARVAPGGDGAPDAAELERRAAQAERDGDFDAAVRLRFAAGLLRLGTAGAIEPRPSLTTGDVARRLRSPRFDTLAETHDAVAYGGRHADEPTAAHARSEWPVVVKEAGRP
jgi:hypothetical protein